MSAKVKRRLLWQKAKNRPEAPEEKSDRWLNKGASNIKTLLAVPRRMKLAWHTYDAHGCSACIIRSSCFYFELSQRYIVLHWSFWNVCSGSILHWVHYHCRRSFCDVPSRTTSQSPNLITIGRLNVFWSAIHGHSSGIGEWSSELYTKPSKFTRGQICCQWDWIYWHFFPQWFGREPTTWQRRVKVPSCSISEVQQGRYRTVQLLEPGQLVNEIAVSRQISTWQKGSYFPGRPS